MVSKQVTDVASAFKRHYTRNPLRPCNLRQGQDDQGQGQGSTSLFMGPVGMPNEFLTSIPSSLLVLTLHH